MTPLRVLMVVPYPLTAGRGNSVAARRLAELLRGAGHRVEVLVAADARDAEAESFAPDLVQAVHAVRSGPAAQRMAEHLAVPLVVSFRGTDVAPGLELPDWRTVVAGVVAAASGITVLTDDQARRVTAAFPTCAPRLRVVPHSVSVPEMSRDAARTSLGLAPAARVLSHVAGVRREKGFPGVLALLDQMHAALPDVQYLHAGAVLDADLAAPFAAWLAARPWARSLGESGRETALAVLAASDVSLHASIDEGLSNALLESLALGVPPVARATGAMRAAVTHEHDGLLFADDTEALAAVRSLLEDPALHARLSAAGRETVARRFTPECERDGYVAAFRAALARPV